MFNQRDESTQPAKSAPQDLTDKHESLHPMEASHIHARRERVFLLLAGLFLGSMTMLNILGISRFIQLYQLPWKLASGDVWHCLLYTSPSPRDRG